MGYAFAALLVFVVALLFGLSSSRGQGNTGNTPQSSHRAEAGRSSQSEYRERLKSLPQKPPGTEIDISAMCYSIALEADETKYVCPKCGEKTLYSIVSDESGGRTIKNLALIDDIASCRRLLEKIKGIDAELDESQFCAKCTPDLEGEPKLILIVHRKGEQEPHRVEGVTFDDIQLIDEYLSGKKKHIDRDGKRTPMKDHLKRLEELLGEKIETAGEDKKN